MPETAGFAGEEEKGIRGMKKKESTAMRRRLPVGTITAVSMYAFIRPRTVRSVAFLGSLVTLYSGIKQRLFLAP